ncbi:unnamed protein product, partial [marine sediment metagenome]
NQYIGVFSNYVLSIYKNWFNHYMQMSHPGDLVKIIFTF